MQTQKETRPTLRAQPLVNDMRYRLFFLRRTYHLFELTSSKTQFFNMASASIFFNSAFSFFNSLSRLASAISIIAVFALPPMKGRFRKVMLAADRLNRLVGIGLTKNGDDLFGAVVFLFHESTP